MRRKLFRLDGEVYDFADVRSGLECLDESRTQQSFADEVDINTIVKRFGLTGQMPVAVPIVYQGDFMEVVNFQEAMNLQVTARESFMELPAHVRARFANDPHQFLEFVSDEKNFDEVEKLGLIRVEVSEARRAKSEAERKKALEAAVAAHLAAQKAS